MGVDLGLTWIDTDLENEGVVTTVNGREDVLITSLSKSF